MPCAADRRLAIGDIVRSHPLRGKRTVNHSTDGVTLDAGFVADLLALYEGKPLARELVAMADAASLADASARVPMQLYNDMCAWIEQKLGPANLRKAGETMGARVHEHVVASGRLSADPTPVELLRELARSTRALIRDPLGRGWEILEEGAGRVVMRRTQTFHPVLQEGLLKALVARSGRPMARVRYLRSVKDGAEFDDYEVTWMEVAAVR
jgi:hypothetical protein